MITDRVQCYDIGRLVNNSGLNSSLFHLIKTNESFGYGGVDVLHPIVGKHFRCKTTPSLV